MENLLRVFTPDLSSAIRSIKTGNYSVRITGIGDKAANSQKPYLLWQLTVDDEGDQKGCAFNHLTPLSGKGAGLLQQFLLAVNPNYDGSSFSAVEYIGKKLRVRVVENKLADGTIGIYPKVIPVASSTENDLERT